MAGDFLHPRLVPCSDVPPRHFKNASNPQFITPATPRRLMLALDLLEKQPSAHQAVVCSNMLIMLIMSQRAHFIGKPKGSWADGSSDSRSVAMMIHPAKNRNSMACMEKEKPKRRSSELSTLTNNLILGC